MTSSSFRGWERKTSLGCYVGRTGDHRALVRGGREVVGKREVRRKGEREREERIGRKEREEKR